MSRKTWAIVLIALGVILAGLSVYGMIFWSKIAEAAAYFNIPESSLRDALKDPMIMDLMQSMLPFDDSFSYAVMLYRAPILMAGVIIAVCGAALACIRGRKSASEVRMEAPRKPEAENVQEARDVPDAAHGEQNAEAAWKLVGTNGALKGKSFILGAKTAIGRNERCDIIYPAGTRGVSGEHCIVYFDGTQVRVSDARSSYGTYIDHEQLPPGSLVPMREGQHLHLGSVDESMELRKA